MRVLQHVVYDESAALIELDRSRARLHAVTNETKMGVTGRQHGVNMLRSKIALIRFIEAGHTLFVLRERTNRMFERANRRPNLRRHA